MVYDPVLAFAGDAVALSSYENADDDYAVQEQQEDQSEPENQEDSLGHNDDEIQIDDQSFLDEGGWVCDEDSLQQGEESQDTEENVEKDSPEIDDYVTISTKEEDVQEMENNNDSESDSLPRKVLGFSSGRSDTTPPLISQIRLSSNTITDKKSFKIMADVIEDESGISRIDLELNSQVYKDGNSSFLYFSLPESEPKYTGVVSWDESLYNQYNGKYTITSITVRDIDGNITAYNNKEGDTLIYTEDGKHSVKVPEIITVTGGVDYDSMYSDNDTAHLTEITLKKTSLKDNESLPVRMEFDRVPNLIKYKLATQIGTIRLGFDRKNPEGNNNQYIETVYICGDDYQYKGNAIETNFKLQTPDGYRPSGEYVLTSVSYDCDNGTFIRYTGQNGYLTENKDGTRCTVKGNDTISYTSTKKSTNDGISPEIVSIQLITAKNVIKPSVIKLKTVLWDNKGISSLSGEGNSNIPNKNYEVKTERIKTEKCDDGILETWIISVAIPGDFTKDRVSFPDIYIYDKSSESNTYTWDENNHCYTGYSSGRKNNEGETGVEQSFSLPVVSVRDEFDYVVDTSITNKQLITKLKKMKDGQAAHVHLYKNALGKTIAKKEIFEAIRGRNVTVVFDYSSVIDIYYQWIINGKKVNSPKDLDLSFSINYSTGEDYGTQKQVLFLNFAENGKLPGEMDFRIKCDYVTHALDLKSPIYLYYDNQEDEKLELQKNASPKYLLDGSDTWLCITITHNSTYGDADIFLDHLPINVRF